MERERKEEAEKKKAEAERMKQRDEEIRQQQEAKKKAEAERRKEMQQREMEEKAERKRKEEEKKAEKKRKEEEERRKREELKKKQQPPAMVGGRSPPRRSQAEHPLHEGLRERQQAADNAQHQAAMQQQGLSQIQKLMHDLNLADSFVVQARNPNNQIFVPTATLPETLPSALTLPANLPATANLPESVPAAPTTTTAAFPQNHPQVPRVSDAANDDVFDDEGFQQVRRRTSKTPSPQRSPPSSQRRQNGGAAARAGLAHSDSFANRMNAASFMDDPVAYDARVRAKNVGLTEMRAARPREPYGFLEPIDYIIAKTKFQNASSNIELDEMDKVCELANAFTNPAKEIIDGQQLVMKASNMRRVYQTLWKRLDELFETSANPFQSAVDSICKKGKVAENDMKAHQALVATLYKLENVAELCDAIGECDRDTHIRRIINARVPHISTDFWKASARQKAREGVAFGFQDMIDEIKHWVAWNTSKEPTKTAQKPTKVAATAVGPATFKEQLVNAPTQPQPTDVCNICGGRHNSHICNVLETMTTPEDRVKKLAEKHLCFHCFKPGHSARDCKEKPTCSKCNRKHATLLHDRQFKGKGGGGGGGEGMTFKTPDPAALAAALAAASTVAPPSGSSTTTPSATPERSQQLEA